MRRKAKPMAIVPRQVLRMACASVVPALMLGGCFGDDEGNSAGGGGTGGTGGSAGVSGQGGFGGIIALAMAGFGGDGGDDAGPGDDAGSD